MVSIIKANGERELFSEEKLINSIRRAGIPDSLQDQVVLHVTEKLHEDIKTSEIFHHITEFLGASPTPFIKSRFSLKNALKDLGPTGYPFEDYIAKLFAYQGYSTNVRTMLRGSCITHEIDVVIEKDGKRAMVEAKFHHLPGAKTDVHVALYTKARYEDIKEKNNLDGVFLVTNTKVSTDAITYAVCVGMNIISWSYPEGNSLREIAEKAKLLPITALTSLPQALKQQLLVHQIILISELRENEALLSTLQISEDERRKVMAEIEFLSA